ncbi:virB8 family protein [Massilia sp. NEAU-DD11]|uniref:VirB8 family protein n=1 Tax=Massilia cellulosiltytica TaxID=2683234 RepID=A0A7X3KBA0_9BURK|nr:virB8 family protein [Telluria cellulosilytica]MVW64472.1 virB8 family protein [Telluria cellulosilytica]
MLTKVEKQDFEQYLREAQSWETNRIVHAEKSKKLAWVIAAVASGIALLSAIAIVGLTPLKRTELRIVRVNDTTGTVDILSEIPNARTTYDEAINRYFAGQYIRFREGYSRKLADEYYSNVGILSAGAEQRRYGEWFSPKNPQSPLNLYGDNARVKVHIKGYSFLKKDVVLVRYWKEVERGASEKPVVTHWAATVVFKYSGAPMAEKDRELNPLGFQVTEYRNDPDTVVAAEAAGPAVATPPAPPAANVPTILPGVPAAAPQGQVPAITAPNSVAR